MDVKTAIQTGDADALRRLLEQDPARANALIVWGPDCRITTHPLHYISDMIFDGTLQKGRELPLVDILVAAGSDVNFHRGETALIGAASLTAEDVGIRLLELGAKPDLRGSFGETALHWASMLGLHRLVERLIPGSDLNLEDNQHHSPPLGWAMHGWSKPSAGSEGRHVKIVKLLVDAGATVEPERLEDEKVRAHPDMLAALRGGNRG